MKQLSLKDRLVNSLNKYKYISYGDVEHLCKFWNYKISNAERRLREMENVMPVKHKKGYITGYKLIEQGQGELF